MSKKIMLGLFLLLTSCFMAACEKEVAPTALPETPLPTATLMPSATIDWFLRTNPTSRGQPHTAFTEPTKVTVSEEDSHRAG